MAEQNSPRTTPAEVRSDGAEGRTETASAEQATGTELLHRTERDGVVTLTMNRPDRRNALSPALMAELADGVAAAEASPTARVVVIAGEGPAFCGGYDVVTSGYGAGDSRPGLIADIQRLRTLGHTWRRFWESSIPIICAVQGHCLAGGMDLVLHSDLMICTRSARFGYPAVRSQGSPPTNMWVQRVGLQWSKRLLLTGDSVSGTTAAAIGLAVAAVSDSELMDAANALASRMALIDKELLMANKLSLNMSAESGSRTGAQDVAAVFDAIAHRSPRVDQFWSDANELGLSAAWRQRNVPFLPDDAI